MYISTTNEKQKTNDIVEEIPYSSENKNATNFVSTAKNQKTSQKADDNETLQENYFWSL